MMYFTGYLIEGEAAEWHTGVAKGISERFGTWKIHEKIPPHITLYRPFETESIGPVKDRIKEWIAAHPLSGEIKLSDFGRFGDAVVFAKPFPDATVSKLVESLRAAMKSIPGMPEEDYPTWSPHATLANRLTPELIQSIWECVSTSDKPDFTLPFDNVTLFRFGGERSWLVDEVFR